LNALNDSIYAPRLRISSLGNEFAKNIGEIGILVPTAVTDDAQNSSSESESNDGSIKSTSHEEEEAGAAALNLPEPNHFLLLHSLFLNHSKHGIMDQLLKEMINFHGNNVLQYCKGNNTEGTLISLPSYQSLKNYSKDLLKPTSLMATLVSMLLLKTLNAPPIKQLIVS
jgi:hypothetical protein